jgi:hypothetical protein
MLLPGEPGNYTIDEVDVIFYLPDVNVTDYSDFSFSITDDNYEVRGDAREFYDLTITVFLGTAAQFATFDVDTNTFEVQEAKLSHELNGRYQVDVVATLTDRLSSRTKVQVYHYFLTISVPERVYTPVCEAGFVIGANCDEDQIFQCREHRDRPCQCCIKAIDCPLNAFGGDAFDTARPVPYVASMSDTGLVEIRWDREMQPPDKLAEAIRQQVQVNRLSLVEAGDQEEIEETNRARQLDEVKDTIEVTLEPKDELLEEEIAYTWNLAGVDDASLWI